MQIINVTKTHGYQSSKPVSQGGINFNLIAKRLRQMGSTGTLRQIESRLRQQAIQLGLVAASAVIRHN
jgi:hypothetical protein